MKKKLIIFFVLIIFCILGFYLLNNFYSERIIFKSSNEILYELENFKKSKGKYPESLEQIGIKTKETDKFFYQKSDDGTFILWLGEGLGESRIYSSSDGRWSD